MPSRDAYLAFLSDFGLSENDVLPMTRGEVPDNLADALKRIVEDHPPPDESTSESERMAWDVANLIGNAMNCNHLLQRVHEQAMKKMDTYCGTVRPHAYPGVFPMTSFNAQCVARSGGFLILLETGCMEVLEAFVGQLANTKKPHVRKVEFLCRVVSAYCDRDEIPQHEKEPGENIWLGGHFLNATEEFMIAHEYGHIVNQHVATDGAVRNIVSTRVADLTVLERNHAQEFEADLWAAHVFLRHAQKLRNEEAAIVCAGPVFFLAVSLLIDAYRDERQQVSSTHPPAPDRIHVVQCLQELLGFHELNYLSRRMLELVGDCAAELVGDRPIVPIFSRELGAAFAAAVKNLRLGIDVPRWITG